MEEKKSEAEKQWDADEYSRAKIEAGYRSEEKPSGLIVLTDPKSSDDYDMSGPYA